MQNIKHIALIGVGLIGGSFVLDLKRQGLIEHVHGIDIDENNLERALERQVIHSASTKIDEAITQADLIMLATPIRQFPAILEQLQPYIRPDTIITEVGSTKSDVVQMFSQYLPHHIARYVPTHPIAGSDRNGALAAQFGLYKNKKIIFSPHEKLDIHAQQTVKQLWQAVGGQIEERGLQEHDQIFASVSHLPHLLAFAYTNQIIEQENQDACFHFAGSGFKDFTRIASSDATMWRDIALENKEFLCLLLKNTQAELTKLQQMLESSESESLRDYFARAKTRRDLWLQEIEK